MDGVFVLLIEVASSPFTHGPLGGFCCPLCWLQAILAIFYKRISPIKKKVGLWAEISWSDNTSRYSRFARVPFTALLYAKISQQILALNHNLFKTLLYWLASGHRRPDFADISILTKLNWRYISGITWVTLWALLCKVSIVCMWKNSVQPTPQSLSNL